MPLLADLADALASGAVHVVVQDADSRDKRWLSSRLQERLDGVPARF